MARLTGLLLMTVGLAAPCAAEAPAANPTPAPASRVKDFRERAELARTVALKALMNATAARDGAEAGRVAAFKLGQKDEIKQAWNEVKDAQKRLKDAASVMTRISLEVAETLAAVEACRQQEQQAAAARDPAVQDDREDEAEEFARRARESLEKAEALTDDLKQEWLIPDVVGGMDASDTAEETGPAKPERPERP